MKEREVSVTLKMITNATLATLRKAGAYDLILVTPPDAPLPTVDITSVYVSV